LKAVFTPEEIAKIKEFGNPGLRLIGFKTYSAFEAKSHYNLKHSVFVYADELVSMHFLRSN
jgi:ATP-dependent DNA helicase 2 subunit 1